MSDAIALNKPAGIETVRVDPLVQAAHLAGRGQTVGEIAEALGTDPEAIRGALRLYNIKIDPKPWGVRIVPTRVAREAMVELEAAAAARAIEVPELIQRLISVAARDRMIDGILDDQG